MSRCKYHVCWVSIQHDTKKRIVSRIRIRFSILLFTFWLIRPEFAMSIRKYEHSCKLSIFGIDFQIDLLEQTNARKTNLIELNGHLPFVKCWDEDQQPTCSIKQMERPLSPCYCHVTSNETSLLNTNPPATGIPVVREGLGASLLHLIWRPFSRPYSTLGLKCTWVNLSPEAMLENKKAVG